MTVKTTKLLRRPVRSRFIIATLIVSLVIGTFNGSVTLANDFYSENNILFYTGTDQDVAVCGGDFEDTGENMKTIYTYMKTKGLNDAQAAGVAGNIFAESGGIPNRSQVPPDRDDPSDLGTAIGVNKAWGLIQWDAGGRAIEYAEDAGITGPIHELETQLQLIWWHMEVSSPTSAQNMLEGYKKINDVAEATIYFHDKVEGSNDESMDKRIDFARGFMEEFSGVSVSPGGGAKCSHGGNGDILETAFLYAWPDVYPRPHTKKKPEYDAAIKQALANGEFVGGKPGLPGVDCGGFVTRVMRDSGVDPEYNSAQGNTTAQAAYLAGSSKYMEVKPEVITDLEPGDIAVRAVGWGGGIGHTYIYAGENDYLNDPTHKTDANQSTVSSSIGILIGGLAPQPGWEDPLDSTYKIYRLITSPGEIHS